MPEQVDRIARRAARLLCDQRAATLREAVHVAMEEEPGTCECPPGAGLVRRHLRGLREQRLGSAGYAQYVRDRFIAIDECIAALCWSIDDLELRVAGAAAAGFFDEQLPVRFRMYSLVEDGVLCELLETMEFAVTRLGSIRTRHGRMTEVAASSADLDVVLLRCQERGQVADAMNLVTGAPVDLLDPAGVRMRLEMPTLSDDGTVHGM